MEHLRKIGALLLAIMILSLQPVHAQMPMPPHIPIWDANKVTLTLHKISNEV